VNKQSLRNALRWGGIALAIVGFILGRTAQSASTANAGRVLVWVGLVMILSGLIVRMFIREP
jgi:VIT1/CCC1 family predicted Fe2+/Mn2+ transporter